MILKEIPDTSIAISLLNRTYKWCRYIDQRMNNICYSSQTYRLLGWFWKKVKICFRNSFWGRTTEINQVAPEVLDNSRIVQYSTSLYKRWKYKSAHYLRTSLMSDLAKGAKERLSLSTVRTASVIIITTIIVNAFLSLVIHKQIGLWGWLMRGLFLLVACAGPFCKVDWPTIKKSSIILRNLGN